MRVHELMTREVSTCVPDTPMSEAARRMWENDCGVVPVVDPESGRVVAMVTDRDLCMAAFIQNQPLSSLPVRLAMSREVFACSPEDRVDEALERMSEHQVRRLPVLDDEGKLAGILSLNDLAVAFEQGQPPHTARRERELAHTLESICHHREPLPLGI